MRSRERILSNLEQIYRDTYEHARQADAPARMADLDNAEQKFDEVWAHADFQLTSSCLCLPGK